MPPALAEFLIVVAVAAILAVILTALRSVWDMQPKSHGLQWLLGPPLFLFSMIALLAYFIVPIALAVTWPVALPAALKDAMPQGFGALVVIAGYVLLVFGLSLLPSVTNAPNSDAPFRVQLRWSLAFMVYLLLAGTPVVMIVVGFFRRPKAEIYSDAASLLVLAVLVGFGGLLVSLIRRYRLPVRRWLSTALAVIASSALLLEVFVTPPPSGFSAGETAGLFGLVLASCAWAYFEWKRRKPQDPIFAPGLQCLGPQNWKI